MGCSESPARGRGTHREEQGQDAQRVGGASLWGRWSSPACPVRAVRVLLVAQLWDGLCLGLLCARIRLHLWRKRLWRRAAESPAGVAVNAASHDVYVADSANHRVDEFSAAGGFIGAFGADVGGAGVTSAAQAA